MHSFSSLVDIHECVLASSFFVNVDAIFSLLYMFKNVLLKCDAY